MDLSSNTSFNSRTFSIRLVKVSQETLPNFPYATPNLLITKFVFGVPQVAHQTQGEYYNSPICSSEMYPATHVIEKRKFDQLDQNIVRSPNTITEKAMTNYSSQIQSGSSYDEFEAIKNELNYQQCNGNGK